VEVAVAEAAIVVVDEAAVEVALEEEEEEAVEDALASFSLNSTTAEVLDMGV